MMIFLFEKRDDIMVKEYILKKKRDGRPELLYFHKVISTKQTQEN